MAYTAWSVVFGEQPTAAKWNQLGANDAGFKDGANIDTGALIARHYAALSIGTAALAANGVTAAKMEVQQAWQAPSLLNSWVNYGSGFDTVGYMKDSLGFVHVRGFIKSGATAAGTIIFNLPVGYRPESSTYATCSASPGSTMAAVELNSSGDVKYVAGNNTYMGLGHIVFKAA
jgi:hypothetical protein